MLDIETMHVWFTGVFIYIKIQVDIFFLATKNVEADTVVQ